MKWVRDPTGRFQRRPYYAQHEIDVHCEDVVLRFLRDMDRPLGRPLSTDDLTVLVERDVSELDLYANLSGEGRDVEGVTEFHPKRRPAVRIAKYLSEQPSRENRLRSTLAHEYGHMVFHNFLWTLDPLVRTGAVSYELLRPLDLYAHWYSRAIALRTAPVLLRSVPLFLMAALFFGMKGPDSPAAAGAFVVAMLGPLLLSSAITTWLSISLMWTISGESINSLTGSAVLIFSGLLVPLPLFPNWAQSVLAFLPFRGLVDAPYRLYLGHIPPGERAAPYAGRCPRWRPASAGCG